MSNPKWPNNKKLPVNNDEIDIVNDEVVSSLQIAALNETTDRSTSKPKASITGQDYTGGDNTANQFQLGTNSNPATGPFISTGATNQTTFTNLYNTHTSKFNGRIINGVDVTNLDEFLRAVLGNQITENLNVACIYVPKNDSGVWTYPTAVPYKSGRGGAKKTNEWMLPPGLLLEILGHSAQGQGHNELSKLADITLAEMSDATKLEPYLPAGFPATESKALAATDTLKQRVAGTSGNPSLLSNNPDEWWCDLKSCLGVFSAGGDPRVEADATCNANNGGTDKSKGYNESTTNSTTFGTPLTVTNNALVLDSTYVDPQSLPPQSQFTTTVPFDGALMVNLATTIFADPSDYALLTSGIVIEILKDSVEELAGADAPTSIQVYLDSRPEQLDNGGDPESNQYDEESVVPAINRVHLKTNKAIGSAVELDQYLTQRVVGNPRSSQPGSQGEFIYDSMSAYGYDPTTEIALGRLNLIPILSGDRLVETVLKLDGDGNVVYDSLGVPQVAYITQADRAAMTPETRRDRFMPHPDSDEPPTTMLEALWTSWRHLSALTTDTYGISALTDVDILSDKHKLLEPMELNSFIQNFNLLYNRTSSLSADLEPIKHALSGEDPGDTLIEQLSSHSIYHNLNTLYTGVSANSACCEINSLSATSNRTDITNLSAFAVELEKRIGAGGGVSTCEGEDICSALTNLHDTIVNLNNPGGYVLCYPANGIEKHFKPDLAWQDTTDCSDTVMPDSDVYRHYEDITGGVDVVLYLWQEKTTNDWYISSGDIDGKFQCSTNFSTKIANPDNKPLDELTLNGCDITPQPSPYPEFTEKINKVIEYVSNPPIIRNPVGRKDPVDIDALSACCDTNTLNLSALSSYVFGDPPVSLANAIKKPTGLDPNGLTDVVNILFQRILTLEEFGGGDGDPQTIINKLNINILSGGLTSLSGDVIDLTDIANTNITNISNNTTDINVLSGTITDLEECCDQSLKLDDIGNHAVLLTGGQSVSGEKIFKETLTVDTSAVIGENITVGAGATVFSVCPDEAAGVSYVQIHDIITISTGDPAITLPTGAIYAMDVLGTDGILRKQLFIK